MIRSEIYVTLPASQQTRLERAADFAGFLLAHAVWCVAEGDMLMPMLGYAAGSDRTLMRIDAQTVKDAVAQGTVWLETNPDAAERAVLAYDGFVTLRRGRIDALIADVVDYGSPKQTWQIILPYRPAADESPFAVHRPKMQGLQTGSAEFGRVTEAFFRGVHSHEKGAEIWTNHLDESI